MPLDTLQNAKLHQDEAKIIPIVIIIVITTTTNVTHTYFALKRFLLVSVGR